MADSEKQGNTEKDTVFYYSRERRLSRASPVVQAMNDESYTRPTLRKVIFGNRGNVMLFISIIVVSVFGLGINYINREPSPSTFMRLGGNNLTITIHRIGEALILGVTKNAMESGEVYIGDVEIAVSPTLPVSDEGEDPPVFSHRVSFRPVASETFHISLPFEGDDFFAVLRAGDEQRSMRLRVAESE